MVLGRQGYETVEKGKNGFVCIVERSWMAPFDDPEFLNPDQRLPLCLNPAAVRSHLPLTLKTTKLTFAGLTKTQIFDGIKAAFDKKELPLPEPGAMCFMMSRQQYFGRKYGNADPHLMFWFPKTDDTFWGAGLHGSPVYVHQYSPQPNYRIHHFGCPSEIQMEPMHPRTDARISTRSSHKLAIHRDNAR